MTTEYRITLGPGRLDEHSGVPVHNEVTASWRFCSRQCQQLYLVRQLLTGGDPVVAFRGGRITGSVLLASDTVVVFGPARTDALGSASCGWCEQDHDQADEPTARART